MTTFNLFILVVNLWSFLVFLCLIYLICPFVICHFFIHMTLWKMCIATCSVCLDNRLPLQNEVVQSIPTLVFSVVFSAACQICLGICACLRSVTGKSNMLVIIRGWLSKCRRVVVMYRKIQSSLHLLKNQVEREWWFINKI